MKLLLGIVIVYNILNIVFAYYRRKEHALSDGMLANLIFSFLLYGDLLVNRIAGYKSSTFVLGIAVCWIISYIIVYARNKMAKQKVIMQKTRQASGLPSFLLYRFTIGGFSYYVNGACPISIKRQNWKSENLKNDNQECPDILRISGSRYY